MNHSLSMPTDAIIRDASRFSTDRYGLIVVGGGIYGVMLTLEATRRGVTALLLERDDFGAHTSGNHLKTLHGGLRYLQSLDLHRFRDSIGERRWFLRQLPWLTRPYDFLMPLYGDGLRRPMMFRAALALDSLMGADRNTGVAPDHRLRSGRVLSPGKTRALFPQTQTGLMGGALWQDGFITNASRLLIELLRWGCAHGARALNYHRVEGLLVGNRKIEGVRARDTLSGTEYEFRAPVVINAAGPWCRSFGAAVDRERPELFPHAVLVWNLLFDRPKAASCGVAVSTRKPKAHTYFLLPLEQGLLIGTGHKVVPVDEHRPPTEEEVNSMMEEINASVPDYRLKKQELRRVYHGIMPGDASGQLADRPAFVDHGRDGGPAGFYSISGVKFTTSRLVADRTLTRLFPRSRPTPYGSDFSPSTHSLLRSMDISLSDTASWRQLMVEESAMTLADLILRRSDLGDRLELLESDLRRLAGLFSASPTRQDEEIRQVQESLRSGLPAVRFAANFDHSRDGVIENA